MLCEYGEKRLHSLYEYIESIENLAEKSSKKIIIWGLGRSGKFLTQLLRDRTNAEVDFYIDEKIYIYGSEPKIYRSSILNYINNEDYVIFSTVKKFDDVYQKVIENGYKINETIFDVYDKVGESYLDYIRFQTPGLSFDTLYASENSNYNKENMEHTPVSFPNIDPIFLKFKDIQDSMSDQMKFIDLGCGNGGALVLAKLFGIKNVSGIELVESLYDQALSNMEILQLDCNIILGNVLELNFDEYNFFYMYNPFRGKVFEDTIHRIEKSYNDNPRSMYIYYGNPFEHKTVIKDGVFKLIEHFETDFYDPIANLYIVEA